MKAIAKRIVCLLSGAVLLCGATGITAGAAPVTTTSTGSVSRSPSGTARRPVTMFTLSTGTFEIPESGSYTVSVVQTSSYTLPKGGKLTYQWYKDDKAVSGATSKSFPVKEAGTYYCKVTEYIRKDNKYSRIMYIKNREYDTPRVNATMNNIRITSQPKGGKISNGSYTITLEAKGGVKPYRSYKWYKDGKYVRSTSTPSYTVYYGGEYYCIVTDGGGNTAVSKTITVGCEPLKAARASVSKPDTYDYITYNITGGTGDYSFSGNGTYNPATHSYTVKAENYVQCSRDGVTVETIDGLQTDYYITIANKADVHFTVSDSAGHYFNVNETVYISGTREHDNNNNWSGYNSMYGQKHYGMVWTGNN